MNILVLDPAASTGYCLIKIEKNYADIYEYGIIDINTKSEYSGDHCLDLMKQLQILIDKHQIKHIAIEDYFFSKKFARGCDVNVAYRTAIHILARQNNIEYTILEITSWKKYIAGVANPSAEQKKIWGNDASKKIFIQNALWKKYGIRFPNHSISSKTKKPIFFRYDIVDAVAQGIYFCGEIKKIESILCSVEVPTDIIFNKPTKKIYVYI